MQQNTIRSAPKSRHVHHRRGIGDTFAGRGVKGQKARVGGRSKFTAGFEGGQTPAIRRYPKLGGFTNINRVSYQPVNLSDLESLGSSEVSAAILKKAGLIRYLRDPIKILGTGKLTKKVSITAHAVSTAAKSAIEKAGGTVKILTIRSQELRGIKPIRKTPYKTSK